MEVHAHAHTPRKKWTHYFWEFLMLFLAVFCGFVAENIREHKVEHDREVQYIKALVEELKEDENTIQQNIAGNRMTIALMDSFLTIISDPVLIKEKGNDVYYMARMGPRVMTFIGNSKTFDQLTHSGGFRLIGRNETANRIMDYYNQIPQIKKLETLYLEEFAHYKTIAAKLFEPTVFRAMEGPDGTIYRDANNPQLRSTDREIIKEFGIYIVYMNGTNRGIAPLEIELARSAKELIAYLKDRYHLE